MRPSLRRAAFGNAELVDGVAKALVDNPGLVFERWYDAKEDAGEHRIRRALFSHLQRNAAATPAYRDAYARWTAATEEMGLWCFEAVTLSRMAIGLGAPSSHENGLLLNRTFGTPVIPASTLKGALRAEAAEMLGLVAEDENALNPSFSREDFLARHPAAGPLLDTFGSVDGMAAITVYDAWWVPDANSSPFALDVLTPHHPAYYTQQEPLPLEVEAPNPVAYLSVKQGARFRFALDLPSDWREALSPVIERALLGGLGAKSAQGYGRMKQDV